jgi:hypothetical protein
VEISSLAPRRDVFADCIGNAIRVASHNIAAGGVNTNWLSPVEKVCLKSKLLLPSAAVPSIAVETRIGSSIIAAFKKAR